MVAFHFPPQAASSGIQRTLSFTRHLGSHDWEPLVLSANPLAYEHKNSSQLANVPHDMIVERPFTLDAKRHMAIAGRYPEVLALPDRWISWWLSAFPVGLSMIRKYKPSLIWSTFPIATAHLIGLSLHRFTGLPWVADFRDPMLQSLFPATQLQRKTYSWIENQSIINCSKAVFTTQSAMDSYKRRFAEHFHDKFIIIENGYDEDDFSSINMNRSNPSLNKNKCITLLHSGLLYTPGRDPSALFQAINTLKTQGRINATQLSVTLRAPGDINFFKSLTNKYNIEDIVNIAPSIPYQEALHEMLAVDGLLVFQGTQFNSQIPAKIYEYFRTRKPIFSLLDKLGETAKVLQAAGFHDMAALDSAEAILPALENFILQIQKGSAHIASDELVEKSSRKNRTSELAQVFNQVTL